MESEKRMIYADDAKRAIEHADPAFAYCIDNVPSVDAVEVPCMCCECYHLLNGKNSFGLYFFCGHPNGLKNIRNTETDFCKYAERRPGL